MRKKYKIVFLLAILAVAWPSMAAADDNAVFGVVTQTVQPNILIIFDTSGSMGNHVEVCEEECSEQTVCKEGHWEGWLFWRYWVCDEYGTEIVCEENCYDGGSRLEIAKDVINDVIDDYGEKNRFGLMRFHYNTSSSSNGGYIPEYTYDGESLYAGCEVKDYFLLDDEGELKTGSAYDTGLADYLDFMHEVIDSMPADCNTPLKETLAEAGLYFAEEDSWYNPNGSGDYPAGTYPNSEVTGYNPNTSHPPIGYRCRQNYIILMTDGKPYQDTNDLLKGEYLNGKKFNNGNLPTLDDIAGFLFENDINDKGDFDSTDYKQNVVTYAIGFDGGDPELLQDTADRGMGAGDNVGVNDGGLYFDATSPDDLTDAFRTIMGSIQQADTTFTASVVPISDVNKAYSGEYVYMSLFKPLDGQSRWAGNLKKYSLNSNNDFASCDSETPILTPDGHVYDSAQSCWSAYPDGGQVDKGGAGQELSDMSDVNRNIYTNISSTTNVLSDAANEFSTDNNELEPSDFAYVTGETEKDELINEIRMVDEEWKLGDLNHSKPAITEYVSGELVIPYVFVGSNDGMLHCFDDVYGREKWAFVPAEQFSRLQEVYTGDHSYFMDGSPTIADTSSDQKILICGERRGGNHFYALDISDINNPEYLYTRTTAGQSWIQPQFIRVKTGTAADAVSEGFLLTGGYDTSYDSNDSPSSPVGNAVFAISPANNAEIFRFDDNTDAAISDSIVSAFGADTVDDGRNLTNLIYAGDLGGNFFGFRDNNNFSNPKALDGSWQTLPLFSAVSSGKKIMSQGDFVHEYINYWDTTETTWKNVIGDYVYFGTGDRADPLRTDTTNYFYCIKNDWRTEGITTAKTVSDFPTLNNPGTTEEDDVPVLFDASANMVQDGTEEEQIAARQQLTAKYNRGWYFELEGTGEKCLSTPIIYAGVVYFTTFQPSDEAAEMGADPCTDPAGGGVSRLYAVDYKTGAAVYANFDDDPDALTKTDRSTRISQSNISIAPPPVLIITPHGEKLSIGPQTMDVKSPRSGIDVFFWTEQP